MNLRPNDVDYDKYIVSEEWREKADAAKERAEHRCQVCNGGRFLDAHHRTYERLGNELDSDITVLCRDCHQLFESQRKMVPYHNALAASLKILINAKRPE
mgnify:CR=1 FL=1